MANFSRRDFLRSGAAAAGFTLTTGLPLAAAGKKAFSDLVPLGQSGVKVSRLAFGTGTFAGKVQRELGQEGFTRLVRYAYDQGIRFFETADAYSGMPIMLGQALKGLPRDSYTLMTKFPLRRADAPQETIDRFRKELNTDYFDILLLHCMTSAGWAEKTKPLREMFAENKQKKVLRAHGASCHGLLPLRTFDEDNWLDVALLRMNHKGTRMDTVDGGEANVLGDVNEVVAHAKKIHSRGGGVLGMKLIGEGQFTTPEDRDASIKFVYNLGCVDSATIGFKSTAEIDEAIKRINTHLNA